MKWLPCSILAISQSRFDKIITKWIFLKSTWKGLLKNVHTARKPRNPKYKSGNSFGGHPVVFPCLIGLIIMAMYDKNHIGNTLLFIYSIAKIIFWGCQSNHFFHYQKLWDIYLFSLRVIFFCKTKWMFEDKSLKFYLKTLPH